MYQTSDLINDLKKLVQIHDVIAISGPPGVGKSEITYQICKELGLKLYEVRLYELGDVATGLPRLDKDETMFTKPYWMREAEEMDADVIFFDDFHSVNKQIQKFFYRFLVDRRIHNWQYPKPVKVILAGNFNIDSAGSADIESPVMGRIEAMIEFKPSVDSFLKWANNQLERFDSRVLAFLRINPDTLYVEDPPPSSKFPSPRNWEHLSKNISKLNSPSYAQGIVGQEVGSRFQDYWDYLNVDWKHIKENPPEDINQQIIYGVILGDEYSRSYPNKPSSEIASYVEQYLSSDAVFLFARQVVTRSNLTDNKVLKLVNHWRSKHKKLFDTLLALRKKLYEMGVDQWQ